MIESMLDNRKHENATQMLKEITIKRYHPLAPYYTYLEGRCYQAKKDFERAEKLYKIYYSLT